MRDLVFISFLILSVSFPGVGQELPASFTIYAECDDSQNCDALYQEALASISEAPHDTTKGRYRLELAEIRKDQGNWDEEVISLYVDAADDFKRAKNLCGEAKAIKYRASFHIYNEEDDLALELAKSALEMAKACGDKALLADVHSTLGVALSYKGEYAEALKAHTEADRLAREIDDVEMQAVSTQEMASIYASMDDVDKSKELMFRAARLYQSIGAEMRYAVCITDICADFLASGQPDSVLHYLPEAGAIFKGKHQIGEAMVAYNMGDAYMQKGEYENALNYYDQASELVAGVGYTRLEIEIELSRSQCYTGMGQDQKAYEHVLKAEAISKNSNNAEGLLNVYSFLMDVAHDVGEHDVSYRAAEEFINLNDSLLGIARQEEVAMLQEQYEAEKREHQIEVLAKEAEIEAQKKTGLAIILVVSILGAVLIINREVQRRKKARQLHQAQLDLKEAQEKMLKEELEFKNRELTSKALHIAQKNEVLEKLRSDLAELSKQQGATECVREVTNTLKLERVIDGNWEQFTQQFTELNPDFYQRLKSVGDGMTKSDLRLAALLRMNLSSKEIASMLNISSEGVKKARQRFRKKVNIESEESLEAFVLAL